MWRRDIRRVSGNRVLPNKGMTKGGGDIELRGHLDIN